MEETLQHKVALQIIIDSDRQLLSDHSVVEILCSILHVPSPDEEGFVQAGDTPTVGDVRALYESMKKNGDAPEHLATWCIQKHNVRLMLHYLDQVLDPDTILRLTGMALSVFSSRSAYAMTELIERYDVLPQLNAFYNVYRMKDTSAEFKRSILTICTIRRYEVEAKILTFILNTMVRNCDVGMFMLLIDRLLEIEGYGVRIQECLYTTILSMFCYRKRGPANRNELIYNNPIPLSFVRIMEERGFEVMHNRENSNKIPLVSFTHDTEDDRYMWDWLTNEIGILPDRYCLTEAIRNNNYSLVVQLVDDGMKLEYSDMIQALQSGSYKMADYLFDVSWGERMNILRGGDVYPLWCIKSTEAMNYFVNVYWRPDEDEIRYIFREIYNKNTPDFSGEREDSTITLLLKALTQNIKERLLQEYLPLDDQYSIWLSNALSHNLR